MKLAFLFASLVFAQLSFAGTEGVFKLYKQPGFKPAAGCDIHTKLTVSEAGGNLTATLQNDLSGICAVMISPNVRTYIAQQQKSDDCGSHVFIAYDRHTGREMFKLVDHASRVCDDFRPSRIEVTEVNEKGVRTELYSSIK